MADLLIKGLEMPKGDLALWITVHKDGTVEYFDNNKYEGYKTLRNAAVPVPPHGRLIDADAIAAYIEKQISEKDKIMKLCKRVGDIENYFSLSKIQIGMVSCRRTLDNAPTIIEADGEE